MSQWNIFDCGVVYEEPSVWDFDFDIYPHWLEDSYYCLGRDWDELNECELKEVRCVFIIPVHPIYWEYLEYDFQEHHRILVVTDEERPGCDPWDSCHEVCHRDG